MMTTEAPARPGLVVRGILKLYPRSWRARYGEELASLVSAVPVSFSLVIDLIAGAIDARLHPELIAHAASRTVSQEREGHMVGKLMNLRCAGYGPNVTRKDQWWSLAVMIGGTIALTLIWMRVHIMTGDNPYVDSFATVPFLAALILSMPWTYLKSRRRSTQVVFVVGSLLLVIAGAMGVGFLTSLM